MSKREAIELLQQEVAKIARLRGLPCDDDSDNKAFKLLRYRVRDIIEVTFGKNSSEYKRIPLMPIKTLTFIKTEAEQKKEYNGYLNNYENCLKSIIQKNEMLGIEEKPSKIAGLLESPKDYKVWQWIKSHKILSIIITAITLIAAIITIVGFVKGFFS